MRILIKEKDNSLSCIEATYIGYKNTSNELIICDHESIWEFKMGKAYAEGRIREAYKDGSTVIEEM